MTCSAAQLAANQKNSKRSTGPRTDEGKKISRRNSLKTGMTGENIVLPTEDAEALEVRLASFEADLKPRNATEQVLVERFALMAIRLERSARQEAKAVAIRMRNASSNFDDARMAEVDHLISWIAHEPVTNNRRLKRSREGISRLISRIEGLRTDLLRQPGYRWDYAHCDQLHHLLGMRREEMPITHARALTEAIHGKFENINPASIPESESMAKRRWALGQMDDLLIRELAKLKTLLDTFDPTAIEIDRAEAADRAMFDDSKEGILARKYEAACERAMYKALRELRELQADSTQAEPEPEVTPDPSEELASFSPEPPGKEIPEADVDPTVPIDDETAPRKRPNLEKIVRKGRRRPLTT